MKNPEKGSNNYFPGSFGPHCKIEQELKDEVALGPPINILLNSDTMLRKDSDLQHQRTSALGPSQTAANIRAANSIGASKANSLK